MKSDLIIKDEAVLKMLLEAVEDSNTLLLKAKRREIELLDLLIKKEFQIKNLVNTIAKETFGKNEKGDGIKLGNTIKRDLSKLHAENNALRSFIIGNYPKIFKKFEAQKSD